MSPSAPAAAKPSWAEILHHFAEAGLAVSADQIILALNSAAEQLFACTAGNVVGQPVTVLFPDWPETGRGRRPEGAVIAVAVRRLAAAGPSGVSVLFAAAAQPEADAVFTRAFAASPLLMALTDPATLRYTAVNEAFLQTLGYTPEDVIDRPPHELNLFAEPAQAAAAMGILQTQGRLRNFEMAIRAKSGEIRPGLFAAEFVQVGGRRLLLTIMEDISERRHTAADAAARSYIDQAPLAVFVADRTGCLKDVNPATCDLLGYTAAELGQLSVADIVAPEDQGRGLGSFHAVVELGHSEGEYQLRHRSGGLVWVNLRAVRLSPERFIAFCQDITAAKQAEAALRQSEARYRLLADHMGDVIWVLDIDTLRFTYVSPSVERLRGYTPAEVLEQPISAVLTPASLAEIQAKLPARITAFLAGDPAAVVQTMEIEQYRRDGSTVSTEVVTTLVQAEAGRLEVIGVSRDISDRKRMEQELRLSEERYRLITTVVSDYAFSTGLEPDGQIRFDWVAGAFEKITGYTFADYVAAGGWPALLHPDDRETDRRDRDRLRANRPVVSDVRLVTRSGAVRWVRVYGHPVWDAGQQRVVAMHGAVQDITARKAAEAALRESEARYRVIFEGATEGIIAVRQADRSFQYANAAMCALFGYPHETFMQLSIADLHPAEALPQVLAKFQELARGERSLAAGVPCRRQDGGLFYADIKAVAARLGEADVLVGFFNDVTERRRADALLRARLRLSDLTPVAHLDDLLQKTLDEAEIVTDSQIGYFHFVEADQTTLSLQTWSTRTLAELCTAEGKGQHYSVDQAGVWADGLRQRRPLIYNDYASLPDRRGLPPGHAPVTRLLTIPIMRNGQIVAMIGVGNKPADYDQQDLEAVSLLGNEAWDLVLRQRAETAQRASEEQYRSLVESQEAVISTVDADGVYHYMNRLAAQALGGSPEAFVGQRMEALFPPEAAGPQLAHIRQVITSGVGLVSEAPSVVAGRRRWYRTSLQPIRDDAGRVTLAMVNAVDITERKEAELVLEERVQARTTELSAANQALAQASRLKDEFLASMSHELRTPLTGILGLAEALQLNTYGTLTDKQRQALANIEGSGRHLLALINDILDLSKIEAGRLDLQLEPCELGAICRASLQLIKGMAHQKRQSVSFTMHPAAVTVRADARRLKQMLVNLLSNAVKFTAEAGALGLEVRASPAEGQVQLTVWDNGIGIAAADLPRLFQPFVQLEAGLTRPQGGTGLGLSLMRRLAELHGGTVGVESTLGTGSRFTIRLPWTADSAGPPEPPEAADGLRRALIVDGNELDGEQLADQLRALGISAARHPQAAGAVQQAETLHPDLILLDIRLPDGSGWSVLQELKASPATQAIPVVMVSVEEDPPRAQALGASGSLIKPVEPADLQAALRRLAPRPRLAPGDGRPPAAAPLILVVDDNDINRQAMVDYLTYRHYRVQQARTGLEALARAAETAPSVILMDIQMPGLDGLETIQRLRARAAAGPAPAIIAVTALAMPGDRERCLAAGADAYLSRPVRFEKVAEQILTLLEQRSNVEIRR